MKISVLAAIGSVAAACTAAMYCAGKYFYKNAIDRKGKNKILGDAAKMAPDKPSAENMTEEASSIGRDVFIKSFDALTLRGVIDDTSRDKFVILCHGYLGSHTDMVSRAEHMKALGYGVLLPDARAHGMSEGDYIGMGWHDRHDVLSWIKYINDEYSPSSLVLFGLSMGATTVMKASGETLPENVKAVIDDCGYSTIGGEFAHVLKKYYKLPAFPVLNAGDIFTRHKAGYSTLKNGSCIEALSRSVTPTLFIHGERDGLVPYEMMEQLYEAAKCPKEKVSFPDAGHTECITSDEVGYWSAVESFLSKYVD